MIRWNSNISLGLSIYVTSASALCDGSNPWFIPIFHLARWNNLTIHRVWLVHIASWIIPGLTFKGLFIQFTNNHLCVPDTSWPHTSFCSSAAGSPSPSWPWDISFSRNKWKLSQLLVSSRLCSDVIGLFQYSYKILNDHISFPWPFRLHNTNMSAVAKVAKPVMRGMHVNVIKKNLILATAVSIWKYWEQDPCSIRF